MRHHNHNRIFGRSSDQRRALMRGLVRDLVLTGAITTTVAKAKELRPLAERLITKGKEDTLSNRRFLISELGNAEDVVSKIMSDIGPRYKERPGGYTRITKLGKVGARAAEMARIELV